MGYDAHFRVWRGDDAGGDLQDFTVEVNEGEVVLDAIHRLQATQTPDLAVRWNCKAGKCGSCSAEVNGRPRLLCMTRMSVFQESETVTVTPLRAFPVVRDLVTDVSFNYQKAREIPAFSPPEGLAPGDFRMQQIDVERSQEFRKCIECFLCQDTCHVIRDHEENKPAFAGPRYFIRLAELDMHPLDTKNRKQEAQDAHGLGYCNITKCCTEVCPEHIKITDNGIIPLKERVVDTKYDPLVWLGSKIPLRGRGGTGGTLDGATPLARQGRWKEAAQESRRHVENPGRGRDARLDALRAHAWTLLCGVEAGGLRLRRVSGELDSTVREAQRLAGSGTILSTVHALHAAVEKRWDDAERHAAESTTWHRGLQDRADDALTLAHVYAETGRTEQARATLERSRQLWPDNPRLAAVRPASGSAPVASAPAASSAAAAH